MHSPRTNLISVKRGDYHYIQSTKPPRGPYGPLEAVLGVFQFLIAYKALRLESLLDFIEEINGRKGGLGIFQKARTRGISRRVRSSLYNSIQLFRLNIINDICV